MDSSNPKIIALLKKGEIDLFQTPSQWPDYIKEYQLQEADIDELIALVTSDELNTAPTDSSEVWAPLHAWRALGQLKAVKAVEPILQYFTSPGDDDLAFDELPEVFGLIGEPAIESLANHLQKPVVDESSHVLVVSGLAAIVAKQENLRSRILDIFRAYMRSPWQHSHELNGELINNLVDLEAVELIEQIRYLFELDCVDFYCCGGIEEVEINLGLHHKRETLPPNL